MSSLNPDFDFSQILAEVTKIEKRLAEAEQKGKNLFPVEVFPLPVQQIIKATNAHLNFPVDFIGASTLYAASVAIGNTHRVEVKKGFIESAVLYLAIVARAGTNKSHPLSFALQPIVEQDKNSYRQYENERQEYNRAINLSKKEREQQSLDEPVKPVWLKFLLSDFTPEALAEVHKFNKRGIGVYVDELAGWFKNFNRYNKGSEMEFWLSGWNSKPINIDRKTGEPVFIPLPFISVVGTIQNGLLHELAKDSRTQNGFMDRILFVIPDNIQKPYWSESELEPAIIENWNRIISKLLDLPFQLDETATPNPTLLLFSFEARQLLFQWQRTNADQCNQAEKEAISGIFSKMEMYVVRLSLILEMLYWACGEGQKQAISKKALEGAIQLVEYFKKSAIKVHSILSEASPLDKFPKGKQELYEALPDVFTTDIGVEVGKRLGMPERTFKRFLNEKELFKRKRQGEYEKLI